MATWQGTGYATTEQVAEYYEVTEETIRQLVNRNKDEFANEVKNLSGQELREVRDILSLSSFSPQALVFKPRGMHRVGFMLRDSEVAKHVRNVTLDIVEAVPNVAVEVESDFIESCKKLVKMRELLGLKDDDEDYRQTLKYLKTVTLHRSLEPLSLD